jgi:predicted Zn-dependent protease
MSDRHDEEPFEVISPLVPDRSGGARAAGGRTGGRAGRRSMRWAWLLAAGVIAMSACMAPPGIAPGPSPRVPRAGSQVSPDDITPAELARASAVQWQLLAERQADAWCLADGACVVTQGLLDRVGASDDRLAAALAHEMAHQLRGHPAERLALLRQSGAPAEPADWLMLPYSRVHEVEADRLGVELLVRAGFDPSAPLGFWEGIREGAPVVPFSARHPVTPSQLRDLTVYADRLEPLKPRAPANR